MSYLYGSGIFIAGVTLVTIAVKAYFRKPKTNKYQTLKKENYKKDVVYFFQFKRRDGLPSFCPYCMKVETFLRSHNIQYEV